MFDYDYRVTRVAEPFENRQKFIDVVTVKPGRRFVEYIQRFARRTLRKFGCKFNPLRFAARKRRGGLSEFNIPQAYFLQCLDLAENSRNVHEKVYRFVYGHIENVRYAFALVFYFESFVVIAFALAHFARNENVGQKVHFYFYYPVARTAFASAAGNVERKSARFIAPLFGVLRGGEQLSYRSERARIRRGVASRSSAYRALIYRYYVVEIFRTENAVAIAFAHFRAVQFIRKRGQKNFVYKRTLATARHARNRR